MLLENLEDEVPCRLNITTPADGEGSLGIDHALATLNWRWRLQHLKGLFVEQNLADGAPKIQVDLVAGTARMQRITGIGQIVPEVETRGQQVEDLPRDDRRGYAGISRVELL